MRHLIIFMLLAVCCNCMGQDIDNKSTDATTIGGVPLSGLTRNPAVAEQDMDGYGITNAGFLASDSWLSVTAGYPIYLNGPMGNTYVVRTSGGGGSMHFRIDGVTTFQVDDTDVSTFDNIPLGVGSDVDYYGIYDEANTKYLFSSLTGGDILEIQDGTDDVDFKGAVSVVGDITAGNQIRANVALISSTGPTLALNDTTGTDQAMRLEWDNGLLCWAQVTAGTTFMEIDYTALKYRIPDYDLVVSNTLTVVDLMAEQSFMEYTTQTVATGVSEILMAFEDNRVDASYTTTVSNCVVATEGWYDCSIVFNAEFGAAVEGDVYMYTNGVEFLDVGGNHAGGDFNAPNIAKAVEVIDSKMCYLSADTAVSWWLEADANTDVVIKHGRIRVERK